MYHTSSIKINIAVILSSILYIGLEFGIYHFTASAAILFAFAGFGGLMLTHIFLEATSAYDACFLFTLLSVGAASILIALMYFSPVGRLLPYHDFLPYLILLHWLLPVAYCTLRCLWDRGPHFIHYNSFFTKASMLFAAYYLPVLAIRSFVVPLEFPYVFTGSDSNLIPFMATAAHIEDFIYTGVGISALLIYAARILLLFLPIGFYGSILLKRMPILCKAFLSICLPVLIEVGLRYLNGSFAVDACIFRFFGILLGILFYQLMNWLFQLYTHEDFLCERNRYSFLG